MESTNASKIMKQSAVEWLVEKLCIKDRKTLINQAKEIEKQRIFDAQVDILSEQIVKEKERSYSEEDMTEAFRVGFNLGYNDEESPSYLTFEEWFEQFKKK
jgi:hypothetical protein